MGLGLDPNIPPPHKNNVFLKVEDAETAKE